MNRYTRVNKHDKRAYVRLFAATCLTHAPMVIAIEQGTNIIGSEEAPTVLNVVPWQEKELSVNPWAKPNSPDSPVLDKVLEPLDRDELRREVEYFNLLHGSEEE